MKKGNLLFLVTLSVLILSIGITPVVLGTPSDQANDKAHEAAVVAVPEHAREISPGFYSIGFAYHNGELVQGFLIFAHNARAPPNHGGGGTTDEPTDNPCFTFLGDRKQKWKTVEDWIVNPANSGGLDESQVLSHLDGDFTIWEDAAGKNIVGTGKSTDEKLSAEGLVRGDEPDGRNEIFFADIDPNDVIAFAIVWMNIIGPPIIVEVDAVYNDGYCEWSCDGEDEKMDFDHIAAHENGHWVGMDHPQPEDPAICPDETMFFQTSEGETKGRDLNAGDIAGIQKLYKK